VGELGRFSAWTRRSCVFCEAMVFLVFVDSPFEDPREGVLLVDLSVEPELWEPEAWEPEAIELGARESWLGAILDGGLRSPLREFSDRRVMTHRRSTMLSQTDDCIWSFVESRTTSFTHFPVFSFQLDSDVRTMNSK
jgi:hypothetical protein